MQRGALMHVEAEQSVRRDALGECHASGETCPPVARTDAFRRADDISEKHAATEGQRTIDLLHVALALECGAKTFLSFDTRQRKLAKAAGLKVKP